MSTCGIKDILVAYPIVGTNKVNRLFNLAFDNKTRVSLDNIEVARGISEGSKRHDMEMEIFWCTLMYGRQKSYQKIKNIIITMLAEPLCYL